MPGIGEQRDRTAPQSGQGFGDYKPGVERNRQREGQSVVARGRVVMVAMMAMAVMTVRVPMPVVMPMMIMTRTH
jgi:hypothetical protein